ncbi:protein transporter SEC13 [Magnaporthiopsis poae ATCC 64411]|uniref:Protein transport protein SEC13 n=1 Tax=Magnaporthiopsis poae (strain ATCC 64411 / 73-15) TaxID=644358 RepID=A0A0C4E4W1_MAGP6|nr:protein transporter SEC13 [Magnaporthiopsis poae ATCC 64411]
MTTQVIANSGHDDMIHDAVLDYYGRRLATCSSDRTIKIFEVEGESHRLTETLKGHEGAVWCVAWAHPKYGNILASSGYDGKVLIWREQGGSWQRIFDFALHKASVNIVSWSPHESGCLLACASSDGHVSVLEFKDSSFDHQNFLAHGQGVNSGGLLQGHTDWVLDVDWSPTTLQKSYIASASQDRTVRIWTSDVSNPGQWQSKVLKEFDTTVWRVSWSLSGNVLAVSSGDNKVTLWKENLRGEWATVSTLED